MKKVTKLSSIVISYIANAVLIFGSVLLTMFLIKYKNANNDFGEGVGSVFLLVFSLIVFAVGAVIKIIVLPLTIKNFVDVFPNKPTSSTKWMILHIVDYVIALISLIYLAIVIITITK